MLLVDSAPNPHFFSWRGLSYLTGKRLGYRLFTRLSLFQRILKWPDRKKSEEIMGEDSLMVKKQAEISSNKCQLKQWDVRSAYYSAWKAYFSTRFLSYSMTGYGIACYFLISMGDQKACAGSWASSLQFFPGFALHGPSWLKVPPWASATSAWAAPGSFFQPPVRAALFMPWVCLYVSKNWGESLGNQLRCWHVSHKRVLE